MPTTLSTLDVYLLREIFAFCGVEDLLRLESVNRKCLSQSFFAWSWRRKDLLMNRIRLCADDQYTMFGGLSSSRYPNSIVAKLSDKALVIRIYRAYLQGRSGLVLLGAEFGSQIHSTNNCLLDVFPSGSESESDSTRMYNRTFVGGLAARAGPRSYFRYPIESFSITDQESKSLLQEKIALFGTSIGASTAFQNAFGQWEILGGWCSSLEEDDLEFVHEEENEEDDGLVGDESDEDEVDEVDDDNEEEDDEEDEDDEEGDEQQPINIASNSNLVLNTCYRQTTDYSDYHTFKYHARFIGNTSNFEFQYGDEVFNSIDKKEAYYDDRKDIWYCIQPRLPRELCYAAAISTNKGHAILTGGALSPYQGTDVYSSCYYRSVDKLIEFQQQHQQRLEDLRDREDDDEHFEMLYQEEAVLMAEINALPSLWQGDVIADLLEPRCGHNLLCLSSHATKTDPSEYTLDSNYSEPLPVTTRSNESTHTQAVPTCAADVFCNRKNDGSYINNEIGESVSIDCHILAVGGYGGGNTYYKSGEMYDLETDQWYRLPDMKDARSGFAACVHPFYPHTTIVVAGGSCDGSNQLNSSELHDIRMKYWASLPNMYHRRGYCSSAVDIENRFWVTGGLKSGFGGCNITMESFDFRMLKWIEESNEDCLKNGRLCSTVDGNGHLCSTIDGIEHVDPGPMFAESIGKAAHHTLNVFY